MVVGLTGGIGSGKSTVLNIFETFDVSTYIADNEAKLLMNTELELIAEIKDLFGDRAYVEGVLDRTYISTIVFKDKEKLKQLNALVHPRVKVHFNEFLRAHASDLVLYEAAILFESGSHKNCDFIISVIAKQEVRIQRLLKRGHFTKEEILHRIENQSDDAYKISRSQFVIQNDQFEHTKEQVTTIFHLLEEIRNK